MNKPRLTFTRPPSVQRTVDALVKWHRHRLGIEPMTGEALHRCAAVMVAAATAYRRNLLGPTWRGNTHHAAKCIETSEAALADPLYSQSNVQIEVEIFFAAHSRVA